MEIGAAKSILPSERWLVNAAEWNPELSSKYRTNTVVGEDGKTTSTNSSNLKKLRPKTQLKATTNSRNHGSMQHEDSGRWTPLENDDTMTAEERYESNARARRNTQSRPASCVNGVRLSDDEVANLT